MIEREEVERLLWSCEHDPKAHLNMTAPALAALCRAWLALDGAPEGRLDIWQNDCDEQGAVEIVMDADAVRHLIHRRVRIVPVDGGKAGQEVGK